MSKAFTLMLLVISWNGINSASINNGSAINVLVAEYEATEKEPMLEGGAKEMSNFQGSLLKLPDSHANTILQNKLLKTVKGTMYSEPATISVQDKLPERTNHDIYDCSTRPHEETTEKNVNKELGHPSENQIKAFSPPAFKNPIVYSMKIEDHIFEKEINKTLPDDLCNRKDNKANTTSIGNHYRGTGDDDTAIQVNTPSEGEVAEDEKESATTMDPVDEEIRHILDYLPKFPDPSASNNNSRYDFQKEDSLDDRITQVARQLAETSLRREFEEKKLGHFIPIRLRQFDEEISYNPYPPSRQLSTGKSFKSPFDVFLELPRSPQISFKPLALPERIYNGPFFLPKDAPPDSTTEAEEVAPSEPVYVTQANENLKIEGSTRLSPLARIATILQLGPRYILPGGTNIAGQNRVPLILNLTPREFTPYSHQNELNGYSYRGGA
ncbi:UNVERIFIED_CONTAM: hypothetical protein PYX00_001681 [Menopon gallinae]|uniref:Uncharacterized protein n=1 Tax=Menopon gallinae TaxID=328185 RepID=A0AAW2IE02_9NEOP